MDTTRIPPAGDPFTAKQHEPTEEKRLAALEDQLAHEMMEDEQRQELRDRVLRLRREIGLPE